MVKTFTSQLMCIKTVTARTKSSSEHVNMKVVNKKIDDLFLIRFNVCSLQKHIDEFNNYFVGFKNQPDIVAISETKLTRA